MQILDRNRLLKAKRSFTTRRIPTDEIKMVLDSSTGPKSGDLVLAKVQEIGSHKRIELPTGRRATLIPGDEIILAYGNRYAPDQYEAYVPDHLGPCHMVAAGGVAAIAEAWHERLDGPTTIEPIGLLASADHRPINLADWAIRHTAHALPQFIFAVFGTSMNSGKTTTAAGLVKGFSNAGFRVGAAKITGTGAGGDLWLMRDSGASEVLDFTDAGFPSTYRIDPKEVINKSLDLLGSLGRASCQVAIIEIADGLYQDETRAIAKSERFQALLDGTFFAAGDAMGAVSGHDTLRSLGHKVLAVSGALTRSPLASQETDAATLAPVKSLAELQDPEVALQWAGHARPMALAAGI